MFMMTRQRKTDQAKRQLDDAIRPLRAILEARLPALDGKCDIIGHELGLLHGGTSIGVPNTGFRNIATSVHLRQRARINLERGLDLDMTRLGDGFRGNTTQQLGRRLLAGAVDLL